MATNNGYNISDKNNYLVDINKFKTFVTPEIRSYLAKYVDPLVLCFKFMPDFSKPYGLISDEKNINSALAYLKRIGEDSRYELLKKWIELFKVLCKEYDFLFLECDGLDEIVGRPPHESFVDTDKISLKMRETSDMMVQSLLSMYRKIWFCDERKVEVLPANLRRLDFGLLVYSSGYYNMALYDVIENNGMLESDVETQMFPTLKKLSSDYFVDNASTYSFNNHFFSIGDAMINGEESAKDFFSSLSNEVNSEWKKTNIIFNFRFAQYKGTFTNLFGKIDITKVLALAAAQDRVSNELKNDGTLQPFQKTVNVVKENINSYGNKLGASFAKKGNDLITEIKNKPTSYLNKAIGANTVLGNALMELTNPELLPNMLKNTIDVGIDILETKFIVNPLTDINNLLFTSYSDNFIDAYKNFITRTTNKNIETFSDKNNSESNVERAYQEKTQQQNIEYRSNIESIYNRNGF